MMPKNFSSYYNIALEYALRNIYTWKIFYIIAGELPDDIGELTSQPDVRLTRTGAKTAPDR